MSLGKTRPLFTQKWVNGLRSAPESAMVGEVSVYTVDERTYDLETDTWVEDVTEFYHGKARVQPIRAPRRTDVPGNSSDIQGVRFSIPVSELADDLRPGMHVSVMAAELNPSLLSFTYVLNSVLDSTNPIERTIEALVDQEMIANG